jgi:peptide-methionine (S)-S-oxide reductase
MPRAHLIIAVALWAVAAATVPPPQVDAPLAAKPGEATAVLAGGCFWGVQAVFEHVRGVRRVVTGYAGGTAATATYPLVEAGGTNHAESVEITYDPSVITYGRLLHVFFAIAHDPTELNRQGPDDGPQYRSVIFAATAEQDRVARAYLDQLNRANTFGRRVVTEVTRLPRFYPAEAYHQDYFRKHPDDPYIVVNDVPKLARLRSMFPELYVDGAPGL